jgi:hypothetical protein
VAATTGSGTRRTSRVQGESRPILVNVDANRSSRCSAYVASQASMVTKRQQQMLWLRLLSGEFQGSDGRRCSGGTDTTLQSPGHRRRWRHTAVPASRTPALYNTRPPKTSPGPVPDTAAPVEAFGSLERPSGVRMRSLLRHSPSI